MTTWNKGLSQLNDALALLVPFPNTALTFLQRANIDYVLINFDGGPLVMWNNILHFANANNQVNALVDAVLEKYPDNPYLNAYKEKELQDYTLGPDINYISWKDKIDEETQEKITGSASTLLPVCFLELGIIASRSVARIRIPRVGKVELGSGFLIDKNIIITNHHVIADKETAAIATIQFDYELSISNNPINPTEFGLDPDSFFATKKEEDWTAVRIKGDANAVYGKVKMKAGTVKKGDFVNIIQHPGGRYKEIGLYHNIVTYENEHIVQYLTDTEPGSSGAPVFNSNWEVVALHHSGGMLMEPGLSRKMLRNEGISIQKVINGIA